MSDTAAVRAIRTMDLIPYILEHPGISISQLSSIFTVSEKEIEKDLQLVFMCGLPGYTPYELIDLTFEDGIVSVIDPQVLDKPRNFSINERVVITLGLEILKQINVSNPENLEKIEKLSKKFARNDQQASVIFTDRNLSFPFLNIIHQAIAEGRFISFDYQSISKDLLSNRKIVPYKLYVQLGNLYLSGYDLQAGSDRVFKADQISNCLVGEYAKFVPSNSSTPEEIVELIVKEESINFLERNSSLIIEQVFVEGQFCVKMKVSNLDWLKRAVLSNAPSIKVISPMSMVNEVEQMAKNLISAYSDKD
jgi:predicted DNA-binding transcriptional regulator YafY